ncbi:glycosyltransferase [Butyrivibrio sp. MB2005]|uniref:glycosyltransferase n=1 Tax=Butyrivibrio sp. MB2005 TaxID=1280678 RepID=UPI0003FE0D7E|nr:glycosyltransferase [Butyrivibrio sp. MB2005]
MCKVSVILPSLNVRKYITECLESVMNQTLKDIEIICVDAGSTDGTLEIIKDKAASDSRIRLILSDMKSYGYQMNLGMAAAKGEYIGIVETDDYVSENMYEELYAIASGKKLDFIKSDFYRFTTDGDAVSKTLNKAAWDGYYGRLVCPMDEKKCFGFVINTWNGIYKTSFIRENDIRHNETPGASFQDNGFWFLTYVYAKRAWFHDKAYYMNRRDNPKSSVFDKSKSFCICDEYDYLEKIICNSPDSFEKYKTVYAYGLFRAYYGNLSRVNEKDKDEFSRIFRERISFLRARNAFERQLMGEFYWNAMLMISDDCDGSPTGEGKKTLGEENAMANSERFLKELKKGIIAWYDFAIDASVLYVGGDSDAIAEYLKGQAGKSFDEKGNAVGRNLSVTVAPVSKVLEDDFLHEFENSFDYCVWINALEKEENPLMALECLKRILKSDGVCLFGMNNRMGIRYFCGDRDPYTDRNFDGIENYRRAYFSESDTFRGRMYDKAEITGFLNAEGTKNVKLYSVLSDLNNPVIMYAENYYPNEDVAARIHAVYNSPETIFLEEESLYKSLIDNDMFHQMANAYLVEFSFDESVRLSDALQITSSMVRNAPDSMLTIIHEDKNVEKINAYPEGRKRLEDMVKYADDLNAQGIRVVDMKLTDRGLVMPFVDAPIGQAYLKELFEKNIDEFLKAMDQFRELILKSSEVTGENLGEDVGAILKHGYLDMVPLNSFYIDGEFVLFDQEFRQDNCPANVIIARLISSFYAGVSGARKILPRNALYERYQLLERINDWHSMEWRFLSDLRNDEELKEYYRRVRRNDAVLNSNRQRMNYSSDDYYKLFVDIFDKADTRKLILFGSGRYAKRFMDLYSSEYKVYGIVDNNEKKWGDNLNGIEIRSPEYLKELSPGEYKVLICIKNNVSVIKQLKEMGVAEISVYDPAKNYPKRRHPITDDLKTLDSSDQKKYHVGYISGVFDLFHVGHLNMFKRAKELCDYLIVGVVSDEGAKKHKKVQTFVPFEERIEMVRSCRYVDEAVEIPVDLNDTKEAFAMYHFDVQFSGSDYVFNPTWLERQEYLREHGADLVFLPYTKSTSSTAIKALIEKGLAD